MATFTVTNTGGAGAGSLRDNIDLANAAAGADTVVFQSGVQGTINLAGTGALQIGDDLTIVGPGADKLSIVADANSNIIEITPIAPVVISTVISGVTLTGVNGVGFTPLLVVDSNLTLNSVTITGNAPDPATLFGAGVLMVSQGNLTIQSSTISNNTVPAGAVASLGSGDVVIRASTITNNNADSGGVGFPGAGGVTALGPGALTIETSTISNNKADPLAGIGGVGFAGSDLKISGSNISGNSGGVGGVFSSGFGGGATQISNTTIANNTGGGGAGGVMLDSVQATITNSTIVGNTDPTPFAVADGVGALGALVRIDNSIVHSAGGAPDLVMDGSVVIANNSLLGAVQVFSGPPLFGANNLTGVDPQLGPLQNNGGPVATMAPLPGSPVIDAGSNARVGGATTDAAGQSRIFGGQVDMGAFEFRPAGPSLGVRPLDPEPERPPPPSQAPMLSAIFSNILRIPASGLVASSVATPDGKTAPNPVLAQQTVLQQLISLVDARQLPLHEAVDRIVDMADFTSSVVTLTGQFFTGRLPTAAELDRLVYSASNPADLNDGAYVGVSFEGRYIDLSVSLGKGEGKPAFEVGYGSLSLSQAAAKAYAEIFGAAPNQAKLDAILTPDLIARFNTAGGDALGAKAAMVGWLLAEAARTDAGPYALANEAFLYDLADGLAGFGADALHGYKTVGLVGLADIPAP